MYNKDSRQVDNDGDCASRLLHTAADRRGWLEIAPAEVSARQFTGGLNEDCASSRHKCPGELLKSSFKVSAKD